MVFESSCCARDIGVHSVLGDHSVRISRFVASTCTPQKSPNCDRTSSRSRCLLRIGVSPSIYTNPCYGGSPCSAIRIGANNLRR